MPPSGGVVHWAVGGGIFVVMTRESLADGSFQAAVAAADPTMLLLTAEERAASLRQTLGDRLGREDIWVFAYGSLIWNPLFRFEEQRVARLRGWHRRFCLWAPVGRGTPERPGLMLGLERGGSCRGIAFRVAAHAPGELELLWQREMISASYIPRITAIETAAGPQKAIAFTINKNSYRYARDLSEERIASILSTAKGEFGSSADYLMRTVSELRAAGIRDRTLERLFTSVSQQNPTSSTG